MISYNHVFEAAAANAANAAAVSAAKRQKTAKNDVPKAISRAVGSINYFFVKKERERLDKLQEKKH